MMVKKLLGDVSGSLCDRMCGGVWWEYGWCGDGGKKVF